ncbi:hypothetical protein IE00_19235 [Paracoccus sp. SM22M-07]|nr:hypothetical protein IE00_19235 [Paracoccus sp. SM22M-07]
MFGPAYVTTSEERAGQIRHLSMIGIASCRTTMDLPYLDDALAALFEVIHRLADEIEDQLEDARYDEARRARSETTPGS